MSTPKLVEHFFRHEYARLVATLSRRVGVQYIEDVEDAVLFPVGDGYPSGALRRSDTAGYNPGGTSGGRLNLDKLESGVNHGPAEKNAAEADLGQREGSRDKTQQETFTVNGEPPSTSAFGSAHTR